MEGQLRKASANSREVEVNKKQREHFLFVLSFHSTVTIAVSMYHVEHAGRACGQHMLASAH